jgi:hypothetical protein
MSIQKEPAILHTRLRIVEQRLAATPEEAAAAVERRVLGPCRGGTSCLGRPV